MWLKRFLVGNPLRTTQATDERLSKRLALAVFSSNALSSVAYATEEILLVLVVAASGAMAWSVPISLAILVLLVFLTISYRQIINEYPEGGGAYVVANLIGMVVSFRGTRDWAFRSRGVRHADGSSRSARRSVAGVPGSCGSS